jgi:23S rRNA (cytosine1962-C5)-methyltransferase
MHTNTIRLSARKDRRVRSGHPWIFSNEIEENVGSLEPGGIVTVTTATGRFIGRGYANPNALIAVRLLSRNRSDDITTPEFYARRFRQALAYREGMYPDRRSCRVFHAESDGVPGLIIDRYNDVLAVQLNTLGLETHKEIIGQAIQEVFSPQAIILHNDTRERALEGLEQERTIWFGDLPQTIDIDEFGVGFRVQPMTGLHAGHYFDQTDNIIHGASLCTGKRVMDLYANSGAFGLHALAAGATEVVFVDKQEPCCIEIETNLSINGFEDRATILCDEGKRTVEALLIQGTRFDVVHLDPPPFAKSRKTVTSALRGYTELNRLCMQLVKPGGHLLTSSRSVHIQEDRYIECLQKAAETAGRQLRMAYRGAQSADHPVLPAVPETRHLKQYAFQVIPCW